MADQNPSPVCLIRDYCVDCQRLGHLTLVEGGEWAKYYLLCQFSEAKDLVGLDHFRSVGNQEE